MQNLGQKRLIFVFETFFGGIKWVIILNGKFPIFGNICRHKKGPKTITMSNISQNRARYIYFELLEGIVMNMTCLE